MYCNSHIIIQILVIDIRMSQVKSKSRTSCFRFDQLKCIFLIVTCFWSPVSCVESHMNGQGCSGLPFPRVRLGSPYFFSDFVVRIRQRAEPLGTNAGNLVDDFAAVAPRVVRGSSPFVGKLFLSNFLITFFPNASPNKIEFVL